MSLSEALDKFLYTETKYCTARRGKNRNPNMIIDRLQTKGYHIRSTNYKLKIGDPPNDK